MTQPEVGDQTTLTLDIQFDQNALVQPNASNFAAPVQAAHTVSIDRGHDISNSTERNVIDQSIELEQENASNCAPTPGRSTKQLNKEMEANDIVDKDFASKYAYKNVI